MIHKLGKVRHLYREEEFFLNYDTIISKYELLIDDKIQKRMSLFDMRDTT